VPIRIILLALATALTACYPGRNRGLDPGRPAFATTDASELFFHNVRSPYYDKEEMPDAGLRVYRLGRRVQDENRPLLNLAIVHNWRRDQAFILIEPSTYLMGLPELRLRYRNAGTGEQGELLYEPGNREDQFRMATSIYLQIESGSEFSLLAWEEEFAFLAEKAEREAFRATMFDFYRLVELQ
jgi:hypothetical protein